MTNKSGILDPSTTTAVAIRLFRQPLRDDKTMFEILVFLAETGEGSVDGLLEDIEECGEQSLRDLLTPNLMETRMEQSMGFKTLMFVTDSPSEVRKKETRDRLISGAVKFEAVAKKLLESEEPHLVDLRQSIGRERMIWLIGHHAYLSRSVLVSGKPDVSDATRLDWARQHRVVAAELLVKPHQYLKNPDLLTIKAIVYMMKRFDDVCQLVMGKKQYEPVLQKLSVDEMVEVACSQKELATQLLDQRHQQNATAISNQQLIKIASAQPDILERVVTEAEFEPVMAGLSKDEVLQLTLKNQRLSGLVMKAGLSLVHGFNEFDVFSGS